MVYVLVQALRFLKKLHIIHCDLKPAGAFKVQSGNEASEVKAACTTLAAGECAVEEPDEERHQGQAWGLSS